MLNFLPQFSPEPILWSVGPVTIRWYGFLMAAAFVIGVFIFAALAKKKGLKRDSAYDLAFWLAVFGLVGARLYEVFFINWDYYQNNLAAIFKIWQGGLAIHGAIITGLMVLWFWSRRQKISFWLLTDLMAAPLALGQAIGRWGNYFNQELFGWPTNWPWGIPIDPANRPATFAANQYFQPVFLYESILDFILFIMVFWLFSPSSSFTRGSVIRRTGASPVFSGRESMNATPGAFSAVQERLGGGKPGTATMVYFLGYGLIRFAMEFIRIDETPVIFGLRLPQVVSLLIILAAILIWAFLLRENKEKF